MQYYYSALPFFRPHCNTILSFFINFLLPLFRVCLLPKSLLSPLSLLLYHTISPKLLPCLAESPNTFFPFIFQHFLTSHMPPPPQTLIFLQTLHSIPTTNIKMLSETIEHVVLFKVKDNTDPSKVNMMVNGLNALISLEQVVHIIAGLVLRIKSQPFTFTHVLHSRYKSKDDFAAYLAHPSHVSIVKENVLPIIDDITAVNWVSSFDEGHVYSVPSDSTVKLTLL